MSIRSINCGVFDRIIIFGFLKCSLLRSLVIGVFPSSNSNRSISCSRGGKETSGKGCGCFHCFCGTKNGPKKKL